jgi:preprotein translocase subunit SecF
MFAVKYRKIFFIISSIMVGLCFASIFIFGFNFGTDFNGGTIIEVKYNESVPAKNLLESQILNLDFGDASVRSSGDNGYIIRMRNLDSDEQQLVKESLSVDGQYNFNLERLNSVGPLIGEELKDKALIAIAAVIFITILYIAYAFRGVSKPVSSWNYGLVSIVALVHDIAIPAGAAVVAGKFFGIEIDALFITALLSLLGYSINDTIIIFDRVRDNLQMNKERNNHESFEQTVGKSLSQTYGRSINTSLTVFIVLIALYIFAVPSIKFFILTLIIGTVAGSYSSIFLAAPLLVTLNNRKNK